MKYRVRILRRAQQDIETCFAFISERSPQGAANWFNRFVETRQRLIEDAHSRPLAYGDNSVGRGIREVLFKTRKGQPYRIVFTIDGDEVLILRVRGPGQDRLRHEEFD